MRVSAFIFLSLAGCATTSGGARGPTSIADEDVVIATATRRSDTALCRGQAVGGYSISDRRDMLNESIATLKPIVDEISDRNSLRAHALIRRLENLKLRSDVDRNFWDERSTCPRRVSYPDVAIEASPNGTLDAFLRALQFKSIALCTYGRGSYSISERQGYLDAAQELLDTLSHDQSEQSELIAKELALVSPLASRSKNPKFWDKNTTCPR